MMLLVLQVAETRALNLSAVATLVNFVSVPTCVQVLQRRRPHWQLPLYMMFSSGCIDALIGCYNEFVSCLSQTTHTHDTYACVYKFNLKVNSHS